MPRTPNPARRAELLSAAVDYAIDHGVADLTLRPLAQALGVQPNTLVHHFGTKEELLSVILNGVRDRLRAMREQMLDDAHRDPLWGVWRWTADPARESFFRFFFEVYGLALRERDRYAPFLERVVSDWISPTAPTEATLRAGGAQRATARPADHRRPHPHRARTCRVSSQQQEPQPASRRQQPRRQTATRNEACSRGSPTPLRAAALLTACGACDLACGGDGFPVEERQFGLDRESTRGHVWGVVMNETSLLPALKAAPNVILSCSIDPSSPGTVSTSGTPPVNRKSKGGLVARTVPFAKTSRETGVLPDT